MIKLYKKLVTIYKLILESIGFAFGSLKGDKFRTFLSLFGVSIGIFSIVTVFTAIDALKANIESGLNTFGGETVYVQQFPFETPEGETYKWWEYMNRPPIKYEEYLFIKSNAKLLDAAAYVVFTNKTIKYKRASFSNGFIAATTQEWADIANEEIEKGRYFSTFEYQSAIPAVIIGHDIAEVLFADGENPIDKIVKVGSTNARVIGVRKKAGESIVNIFDSDNSVLITLSFASTIMNIRNQDGMICLKPAPKVDRAEFLQEMRHLLRAVRRLKPKQNDNFALNQMSFILDQTKTIFGVINMAGWVIGGFSILIGGFGIANIMFVSVKERTNLIGIQKALGAKKYMILTQFLAEAAVLAITGGLIGILMVSGVVLIMKGNDSFPMSLSLYNIFRGLLISSVIGVVSGFLPARSAANLNPVDAINSK